MIDEKFLEFWGNFMINSARTQKQSQEFFQWMKTGLKPNSVSGQEDLYASFKKFYGLDKLSESTEEYRKMTDQALRDFRSTFKEYLNLMGVVSRGEYLDLIEKYETLKEKSDYQQETINHLKTLLKAKQGGASITQFEQLAKTQNQMFKKIMNEFMPYFKADSKKEESTD